MYFQAFRAHIQPALPETVVFTVESLVSQMLATADLGFLQAMLQQQRLAQALFEELDCFGQVPKHYLPEVKTYLKGQEQALAEAVERIVKEPDNDALREQLCQPATVPC